MKKLKNMNPLNLIVVWLLGSAAFTLIGVFLLAMSSTGGEQKPFTFLISAIHIMIYGTLAISIISIPFYIKWVKENL